MRSAQDFYPHEITPEQIAEVTRRARIERSRAFWRILQGIFRSSASDAMSAGTPKPVG